MVFSSLIFLYLFFPLSLLFYFLSKNLTYRNIVLIVFSLAFYAWGEPVWIILLILSASIDFFHSLLIKKYRSTWVPKAALISSIILNLSLLVFFKYSAFLVQNINLIFGINIPFSEFSLPIGISFYTFQTMSYTIDVYRGDTKAQQSYFKFLLYVSLFHQLVAGPIVRYSDIANEIECRSINISEVYSGINRFVIGLGKKVLIANTAGELAEPLLNGNLQHLTTTGAWLGILTFTIQIYFDFSGYSDMAIGMGKMVGFHYKENFNYPYMASSVTDFWRRWHISLGSFFRDYLYIPLGGNRSHYIRNIIVVWFLTGLWHGASWNFVVWGLFYGFFIILEKKFLLEFFKKLPAFVSHIYLLFLVVIGWVFFQFTNLETGFNYLGIMFGIGGNGFFSVEDGILMSGNLLFLIIAAVGCTPMISNLRMRLMERIKEWKYSDWVPALWHPAINILLLILCTAFLIGKSYNPFLYFRF